MEFFKVNIDDFTRAEIKALFRRNDESHLFPICGKFNATERAIRRLNKAEKQGLVFNDPIDYALALDEEIGLIVNSKI